MAEEKTLPKGAFVFEEGQEDRNFYIVLRGEVEISKKTTDGEPKIMAHLKTGDFFGEGVLSGVFVKPASATALTPVTLLFISHEHFYELLKGDPQAGIEFLINVMSVVNHRLKKANDTLVALFEMDHLLMTYRDNLNQLGKGMIEHLSATLEAQKAVFLLKNPYESTYRVIATTHPDLNEGVLKIVGTDTSAIQETEDGSWMGVQIGASGLMVFGRPAGRVPFLDEDLRLALLVADEAEQVIENAYHRASDKARQLLQQKKIVL